MRPFPARCNSHLCDQMPYNWLMWYIRVTMNSSIIIGNAIAMLALFFVSLPGWGNAVSAQVTAMCRTFLCELLR